MNVWRELTKRRELTERFVVIGLVIAMMGAVMWLWSVMGGGDDDLRGDAIFGMVWGLFVAGVAMAVIAYRKRDRADN